MNSDWAKVGKLLRRARGTTTVTDAAYRAGVSRSWWQNVENGSPKNEPKPEKLAGAVRAVDGPLEEVFTAAGFDASPFIEQQAEDTRADWAEKANRARAWRSRLSALPHDDDHEGLVPADDDGLRRLLQTFVAESLSERLSLNGELPEAYADEVPAKLFDTRMIVAYLADQVERQIIQLAALESRVATIDGQVGELIPALGRLTDETALLDVAQRRRRAPVSKRTAEGHS